MRQTGDILSQSEVFGTETGGVIRLRASVRAAQAVALLLGFYVLGIGTIIVLLVLDIVAVRFFNALGSGSIAMLLFFVPATVLACVTVARGVGATARLDGADMRGVAVTPEAEPELWARVQALAATMGTRGPRRILISPEVDAAVWESSHLLGLFPGRRYLILGLPLLLALSPAQMDAVIAHELGHYGNYDTRLGPVVNRGRAGILTALRAAEKNVLVIGVGPVTPKRTEPRGWWYFVLTLRFYAHLFFSLTQATSRAQEYAADRASALAFGRDNAVSALAELPVIAMAYRFYLDGYAYLGLPVGLVPEPAQVIGGFSSLMNDPQRADWLDRFRRDPADTGKTSRFDSHPPLTDRLAVLRTLPDDGLTSDDPAGQRAAGILRHQQSLLVAVGKELLGSTAAGKAPVDWDSLVDTAMFHRTDQAAAPLINAAAAVTGMATPTPEALVDAVDAGRLTEILDRLAPSGARSRDAASVLAPLLRAWILVRFAERGQVRWIHSWSGPTVLQAPPGLPEALDAAIAVLLGPEPDCAPLRAVLSGGSEQNAR